MPQAKSKQKDDLNSIMTLGFRGEALASIAAVSKVDILTRTADETFGTRYSLEGGEQKVFDDAGCPVGTTIVVKDLFFNTPARMKFLKKNVSEGNAVADAADRMALSHPEVSVKLTETERKPYVLPATETCFRPYTPYTARNLHRDLYRLNINRTALG